MVWKETYWKIRQNIGKHEKNLMEILGKILENISRTLSPVYPRIWKETSWKFRENIGKSGKTYRIFWEKYKKKYL